MDGASTRETRSHAVSKAAGEFSARRTAAEGAARITGDFRRTVQILADDEVEKSIGLAGAYAGVVVTCWQLDDAAQRQRNWLRIRLTQQIDFGAEQQVADFAARPSTPDEWKLIDYATHVRIRREDRSDIAIDAGYRVKRSKDLEMRVDAHAECQRKRSDVRESFNVVVRGAIAAGGPFAAGKHLGSRNVPETGVAVCGCESWSCVGRRCRALGVRCCGHQRAKASQPQVAKRSHHRDEPPSMRSSHSTADLYSASNVNAGWFG